MGKSALNTTSGRYISKRLDVFFFSGITLTMVKDDGVRNSRVEKTIPLP
jgi:hypothetical protein